MALAAMLPSLLSVGGGLLSGLFGKKSSTWSGKNAKIFKENRLTSEQRSLLKDLSKHPYAHLPNITKDPNYQAGTGYLQKIISQDPELMKQFEAPAMRQFNEQIVPGIAERFSGMGAQNSSAFQQTMGQAGSGLSERLAAMRAGLGMDAAQQLYGYSQLPGQQKLQEQNLTNQRMGLALGTNPYEMWGTEGTSGLGSGIGAGLMQSGFSGLFGSGGSQGILSNIFSKLFG